MQVRAHLCMPACTSEFKRRIVSAAQALRVGDPADERTQMGPLISHNHRASVERYVQLGLDEGGALLCGGAVYRARSMV